MSTTSSITISKPDISDPDVKRNHDKQDPPMTQSQPTPVAPLTTQGPDLKKLLVVISADLVEPRDPTSSVLVRRALEVAKNTGANLEFLHVVYEPTLDFGFFSEDEQVVDARNEYLDDMATLMSEFVTRLPAEGLNVEFDVRWDDQRADAIVSKAVNTGATMIMKQARDHQFVLGVINNVDWSLLRGSPIPVWFVKDDDENQEDQPISRVVSAVGSSPDQDEIFQLVDFDVVRLGATVSNAVSAFHKLAHTYNVPRNIPSYASYAPMFATPTAAQAEVEMAQEMRVDLAQKHGQRIQAFAEFFGFEHDDVILKEGHPKYAIPQICEKHSVDLLVMSVFSRTMLERMWKPVTAEPVLSRVTCDVIFVPSAQSVEENQAVNDGFYSAPRGEPEFDLERAIVTPSSVFEDPRALLVAESISVSLRCRILQSWRLDLHSMLTDIGEGGENTEALVDTLDQVNKCLTTLEQRPELEQSF